MQSSFNKIFSKSFCILWIIPSVPFLPSVLSCRWRLQPAGDPDFGVIEDGLLFKQLKPIARPLANDHTGIVATVSLTDF